MRLRGPAFSSRYNLFRSFVGGFILLVFLGILGVAVYSLVSPEGRDTVIRWQCAEAYNPEKCVEYLGGRP